MINDKPINFSEIDRAIATALEGVEAPMGLTELAEATGIDLKPGHLSAALKKHVIEKEGVRVVIKQRPKTVATYDFISAVPTNVNGKGEAYELKPKEEAILKAAAAFDADFSITDLSETMGEPVFAASLTTLVKKGCLAKGPGRAGVANVKSEQGLYVRGAAIID